MSWLTSNLSSSFSEFTNQISSLTSEVLPGGIVPQSHDDGENDSKPPVSENGVTVQESSHEDLSLPVSEPVAASSGYQDVTFSPVKDNAAAPAVENALSSTPNSSRASFAEFLGETGSFVGDAASFVGAGGETPASKPGASSVKFGNNEHDGVKRKGGAAGDALPATPSDPAVEKLVPKVEEGEAQLAMLRRQHEDELRSLRESHKLKLQAMHDHQQADAAEMEQRIAELESQRQQAEERLRGRQQQLADSSSASESRLASLQESVDTLTSSLKEATQQADENRSVKKSLETDIQERDRRIASLQESSVANQTAPCTNCNSLQQERDDALRKCQHSEGARETDKEKSALSAAVQLEESERRQAVALAALSDEHDKLKAALEEHQRQLAREKNRVEELTMSAGEASRLSEQLVLEQAKSSEYARSCEDHQTHALARDEEVKALQEAVQECRSRESSLMQECRSRESSLMQEQEALRAREQESTEQYRKLQAEHEIVISSHTRLQQQLEFEQSSSESLRSASVDSSLFEEMKTKLAESQQQHTDMESEMAALRECHGVEVEQQQQLLAGKHAELQRIQEGLSQELASEKEKNAELVLQAVDMELAERAHVSELDKLRSQHELARARESGVVEQLENSMAMARDVSEKHAKLVADHDQLSSAHSNLREELAAERIAADAIKKASVDSGMLTSLQSEFSQCQQQLTDVADERARLHKEREDFDAQFTAERERYTALDRTSQDLQAQLSAKETGLRDVQASVEDYKAQESRYLRELKDLQAANQLASEEHSKLAADHAQLSTAFSCLQQDLSTERSALESVKGATVDLALFEQAKTKATQQEEQLVQALEEMRSLKEAHASQTQHHEQLIAEERSRLQAAQEEKGTAAAVQEKCHSLEQLLSETRSKASASAEQVQTMQSALDERRARGTMQAQELEESRRHAQHAVEEHSKLLEDHHHLRLSHSALQEKLLQEQTAMAADRASLVDRGMFEQLQSSANRYQQQIAEADRELIAVKESLRSQVEASTQSIADERAAMQTNRDELAAQMSSVRNQTDLVTAQRDDLQAQLEEVTALNGQLRTGSSVTEEEQERQQRESDRLRQHLLMVEEQHTQDLLDAENVQANLREELSAAQQAAEARAVSAESDLADCHQEIQSLQERVSGLAEERNLSMQQYLDVEKRAEASSSALARLQLVLEQFQKEHEDQVSAALRPLETKLNACQDQIESYESQLAQCQVEIDKKASLEDQLRAAHDSVAAKRSEVERLKINVADSQTALDSSQEKVHKLSTSSEGKVDINLVRNLLLTYLTASTEKRHEVLRPVASILGFSGNEMKKVSSQQGSWLTSWLSAEAASGRMAVPSDKSFTELFVQFLESESLPGSKAAGPGELSASAVKDGHISTSRLPASAFANKSLPLSSDPAVQLPVARLSLSSTPTGETPLPSSQLPVSVVLPAPGVATLDMPSALDDSQSYMTAGENTLNETGLGPMHSTPVLSRTRPGSQSEALRTILAPDS